VSCPHGHLLRRTVLPSSPGWRWTAWELSECPDAPSRPNSRLVAQGNFPSITSSRDVLRKGDRVFTFPGGIARQRQMGFLIASFTCLR
jgi:hypothetical protein